MVSDRLVHFRRRWSAKEKLVAPGVPVALRGITRAAYGCALVDYEFQGDAVIMWA